MSGSDRSGPGWTTRQSSGCRISTTAWSWAALWDGSCCSSRSFASPGGSSSITAHPLARGWSRPRSITPSRRLSSTMSTAGSGPRDVGIPPTPLTPGTSPAPAPSPSHAPAPAKKKRLPVFRWRAILPLGFSLLVIVGGWLLFGDLLLKLALVKGLTAATGAEVDVGSVHVGFITPSLEIKNLQLASTSDSSRNLIQFSRLRVIVDGLPLLQKKVVVRDVSIDSMRAMAKRRTPARRIPPSPPNPMVQSALKAADGFASQFKVKALSLVPVDSIKSLVLKPEQMQTVQAARVLGAKADSFKNGVVTKFNNLKL